MSVKSIYWSSTLLVSLMLLYSSYSYLFSASTISGIKDLGFPDYFRIQLAVLKLIAVLLLLIPNLPVPLKEWTYAGVVLFFLTAIIAHAAHKDPVYFNLINVVFIGLAIVSRMYWFRLAP
ncbi:MAG: DoxX family protein [Flavobacteriaceae bacterium]|nr:DoxX family protein [Flavobacteriaceae bacterium]